MTQRPFELSSQTLGALPIVDAFLERMGVDVLLERVLGVTDARVALRPANAIGLLVRNLCVNREPIYALGEWAAPYDPRLLGLSVDDLALLNDDRVGRALDRLFDADRASLLTELMLGVISEFNVDCSQLHNDSTSITLTGAYRAADGHRRAGKPTPAAAHGHNKEHRPDLKQLLWILTVSADGAVPLAHRHRWQHQRRPDAHRHVGRAARADWARGLPLRRRLQAVHARADESHRSPRRPLRDGAARSRREDGYLREWAHTHQPQWTEALRRPAKRKGDPDEIWHTTSAPICSSEGHRIVWVHSTQKASNDAEIRQQRIERGLHALAALNERLHGPKSRLRDRVSIEQAATAALAGAQADRWITPTVHQSTEETLAKRRAGGPARTPATERSPVPTGRSSTPSTPPRLPTTPQATGASR